MADLNFSSHNIMSALPLSSSSSLKSQAPAKCCSAQQNASTVRPNGEGENANKHWLEFHPWLPNA